MALNTTTLSLAVAINDKSINVASATGAVAGAYVKIDGEVMQITKEYVSGTVLPVIRAQDSTQPIAHVKTANVLIFLGTDAGLVGPGGPSNVYPTQPARVVRSYIAAGAITLPVQGQDMIAEILSTAALAMTLAAPTTDMDGSIVHVIGNGKAAHTLAVSGNNGIGNGGAGYRTLTFAAGAKHWLSFMAQNGDWVQQSVYAGTTTNVAVTLS